MICNVSQKVFGIFDWVYPPQVTWNILDKTAVLLNGLNSDLACESVTYMKQNVQGTNITEYIFILVFSISSKNMFTSKEELTG